MVRLLCLLLAALLAAGCKSPPKPSLDPFLGRATVPPPKPGEVVTQRADPYYAASPPPPASATNRLVPPAGQWSNTPPVDATARTPIRQQSYQQPVTIAQPAPQQPIQIVQPVNQRYQPQPNCRPCPQPARAVSPEELPPGTRSALNSDPRSAAVTSANDSVAAFRRAGVPGQPTLASRNVNDEPRRLEVDEKARDIMDLPPATRPGSPTPARGSIQNASYDEAVGGNGLRSALNSNPTARTATPSATIRSRYGYDSDYKWLKGQLEYSKAARRWKLRYIPLDGETDAHGGSVVLADSPQLEKFEPGDYVLVDGQIQGRNDANEKTFSPLYQVTRIDRAKP